MVPQVLFRFPLAYNASSIKKKRQAVKSLPLFLRTNFLANNNQQAVTTFTSNFGNQPIPLFRSYYFRGILALWVSDEI